MVTGNAEAGGEARIRLHQLPLETLREFWRDFEPSDYKEHRKCGFIPTAERCYVCNKQIGRPLAAPYSYQDAVINDDHLNCLIAGGEQTGKSFTGAMKFFRILMGFLGEYRERAANEVAWLIGASYEQTAREFEYIKIWLKHVPQIQFQASDRVDPGEISINVPKGLFRIKTKSSDDAMNSLRMESPVVALVCEAAITTFDTYTRLRSRVARARADFPGYGAIIMISTFEGSLGWYPVLYGKWQVAATQARENAASYSMPSFTNIFIYKKGEKDREIRAMKAELSEDEYNERVLAVPSPPRGRVFHMFDPTMHILPVNARYNPGEQVLIGIDPGWSGQPSAYAVEAVQRRRLPCNQLHYQGIDEIFETRLTNEQICSIAMNRPWWRNEDKVGVVDIAGTYHAGAQPPVAQVWKEETGLSLRSQKVNILPGIERMSAMFNLCPDPSCGQPVFVLSPVQAGAIAEFGGLPFPSSHPRAGEVHPYSWARDRTGQVIGHTPDDRYCDAVRSLTYLFINQLGYTRRDRSMRDKIRVKKRPPAAGDGDSRTAGERMRAYA